MLELVENVQLFQESHGDQIRKHGNCSSLCNRIQIWRDLSFHSLQKYNLHLMAKFSFVYLGIKIDVAFPVNRGFSRSFRRGVAVNKTPWPFCILYMSSRSGGNVFCRILTR